MPPVPAVTSCPSRIGLAHTWMCEPWPPQLPSLDSPLAQGATGLNGLRLGVWAGHVLSLPGPSVPCGCPAAPPSSSPSRDRESASMLPLPDPPASHCHQILSSPATSSPPALPLLPQAERQPRPTPCLHAPCGRPPGRPHCCSRAVAPGEAPARPSPPPPTHCSGCSASFVSSGASAQSALGLRTLPSGVRLCFLASTRSPFGTGQPLAPCASSLLILVKSPSSCLS